MKAVVGGIDAAAQLGDIHEQRFEQTRSPENFRAAVDYNLLATADRIHGETAYTNLGLLYAISGDEPRAVQTWTEGLTHFPGSAALRQNLSIAAARKPGASSSP